MDEVTQQDVERAWPGWKTYTGTDGLCHAKLRRDPAVRVSGEDWQDCQDQIVRFEALRWY